MGPTLAWRHQVHQCQKYAFGVTGLILKKSEKISNYRKVASSRLLRLAAHFQIFRRLMKGKFDAYVLWPLVKKFQNWIVDRLLLATLQYFLRWGLQIENYLIMEGNLQNSFIEMIFFFFWIFWIHGNAIFDNLMTGKLNLNC